MKLFSTSGLITIVGITGLLVIIAYSLFQGSDRDLAYSKEILKERIDKNKSLRNSKDSPFAPGFAFDSLNYYPPNPELKISATFQPIANPVPQPLALSGNNSDLYLKTGFLEFEWNKKKYKLGIWKKALGDDSGAGFVPFTDETNITETYPAGRYIDIESTASNTVTLDFNRAYNPYCAYSAEYKCPVPPAENKLDFAVKAGEKVYHLK